MSQSSDITSFSGSAGPSMAAPATVTLPHPDPTSLSESEPPEPSKLFLDTFYCHNLMDWVQNEKLAHVIMTNEHFPKRGTFNHFLITPTSIEWTHHTKKNKNLYHYDRETNTITKGTQVVKETTLHKLTKGLRHLFDEIQAGRGNFIEEVGK